MSSPWNETFSPGVTGDSTSKWSSRSWVYSSIITESAPIGMGAPVAILTASPFLTVILDTVPAPIRSIIVKVVGLRSEKPNESWACNA